MRWSEASAAFLCFALAAGGCAGPGGERYLAATRGNWVRLGTVQRYTARDLYDAIDGEAPFVISFGFRSLAQAQYGERGGEPLIAAELYDMGRSDNAFALFRAKATLESKPIELGTEGAGDGTRVEFWQGPFYGAVTALPSAAAGADALAFARELARSLPPTRAWPACLALLPPEHRIARSEQYTPSDFLGDRALKRAVSARYRIGGHEATLFACHCDGPADAAAALARLRGRARPDKPPQPLTIGEEGFIADEPGLGTLAVFRRGAFLAGAFGSIHLPAFGRLLAELSRRLEQ